MVTRIGNEDAPQKLVIASPHGDERNAQRLIMAIQKYFLQHGSPEDTLIYFVPCLSPTMCFSDARGIPNIFWKNEENKEDEKYGEYEKQLPPLSDGKFKLGSNLTIPALHNELDKRYTDPEKLIRDLIQAQDNPSAPIWGVDANRDVTLSLPSNQAFSAFINDIQSQLPLVYTETNVKIYDPADQSEIPSSKRTINNLRVLMIHGYDNRQSDGCVYGPYSVKRKRADQRWPARISIANKQYINEIRRKLGWGYPLAYHDKELGREHFNSSGSLIIDYPYLYDTTAQDARKYEGEWAWHLYHDKEIWVADIELLTKHDEGVRGSRDGDSNRRPYEEQLSRIDNFSSVLSAFTSLLNDFPWR